MVNRLLGALAEDDIYSRTLFHRWGDFSERLYYSWNTQWDKKHLVFSPGPRAPARTQWDKKHMDIGAMLPEIQGGCYAPAGLAGIGLLCGGE